jgi:hypothetical protein
MGIAASTDSGDSSLPLVLRHGTVFVIASRPSNRAGMSLRLPCQGQSNLMVTSHFTTATIRCGAYLAGFRFKQLNLKADDCGDRTV